MWKATILCKVIGVSLLALVLQQSALSEESQTELRGCGEEEIQRFFDATSEFSDIHAKYVAEHCHLEALPALTAIFEDESKPFKNHAMAAMCLGELGSPDSAQTLIDYVQRVRTSAIETNEEYGSILRAMTGLGRLGTAEGVEFLASLCSEDYWLNRSDRHAFESANSSTGGKGGYRLSHWRKAALVALTNSGSPLALEVLRGFRTTGTVDDFTDQLEARIATLEKKIGGNTVDDDTTR